MMLWPGAVSAAASRTEKLKVKIAHFLIAWRMILRSGERSSKKAIVWASFLRKNLGIHI
jgi:hypothetical protein